MFIWLILKQVWNHLALPTVHVMQQVLQVLVVLRKERDNPRGLHWGVARHCIPRSMDLEPLTLEPEPWTLYLCTDHVNAKLEKFIDLGCLYLELESIILKVYQTKIILQILDNYDRTWNKSTDFLFDCQNYYNAIAFMRWTLPQHPGHLNWAN